jgi:hypothetical protein
MDIPDGAGGWVILAVAAWGALTGTVAVFLEVRRFRKERPQIKVEPKWEYSWSDYPPQVALIAKIANAGHRPTTIERVYVIPAPTNVWRVDRWWKLRRRKIPVQWGGRNARVGEGEAIAVRLSHENLPKNMQWRHIRRVMVQDVTGRQWKSPMRFNQRAVDTFVSGQEVEGWELGNEGGRRYVRIRVIRLEKGGLLYVREKKNNTTKMNHKQYRTLGEAKQKGENARGKADLFIAGDIDSVLAEFQF